MSDIPPPEARRTTLQEPLEDVSNSRTIDPVESGDGVSANGSVNGEARGSASSTAPAQHPQPDLEVQAELRRNILKIQSTDISDREKAHKMQALLTQGYNAPVKPTQIEATVDDKEPTYADKEKGILGCKHYKRAVKLQCHTCNAWSSCRFCHDDSHPDHKLVRQETKNMLCMYCGCAQPAGQNCKHCKKRLAKYYCDICRLWDDDPEKKIYHCPDCGICRIGEGLGKDFFHCKGCGVCMSMSLQNSHRCIERSTECDCPICGEFMFTSTQTVVFMQCGHSIHQACYEQHIRQSYKCPTCSRSLANMDTHFRLLDAEIVRQPMPEPYDKWKANVLCNDCSAKSRVQYHFLGHRCDVCASYNTVLNGVLRPGDEDYENPLTAVLRGLENRNLEDLRRQAAASDESDEDGVFDDEELGDDPDDGVLVEVTANDDDINEEQMFLIHSDHPLAQEDADGPGIGTENGVERRED
ncbi:hypothetical protein YB2330_000873 [Saitoella coloradoensis]